MRFTLLIAILIWCGGAAAHDPAATYVGNAGVLVARGETKILFDAFYSDSYDSYVLAPDEISDAMLNGEAPYDGVDAIFVSHVHGDHFSPEPTLAYLRAHPGVTLYAPAQIRGALMIAGVAEDDPVMARVVTYDLGPEDPPLSFDLDGLSVDVVAIPHAGNRPNIQNFAWRVTLDARTTVMHLGDAGAVREHFDRHAAHFAGKKTHAAFPPYWFYLDENGVEILETVIRADQVIGVHVPAAAVGNGDAYRARAGGDLFTDPGETRAIPAASTE